MMFGAVPEATFLRVQEIISKAVLLAGTSQISSVTVINDANQFSDKQEILLFRWYYQSANLMTTQEKR